jgi:hypothetical protein
MSISRRRVVCSGAVALLLVAGLLVWWLCLPSLPPDVGHLGACTMDAYGTVYTCTADQVLETYVSGSIWFFKVPVTNPGAMALRISPLPAFPIQKGSMRCSGTPPSVVPPCRYTFHDVEAGDLRAGALMEVVWNGYAHLWQLGWMLP